MSNLLRKIERNKLKKELGSNKIQEKWQELNLPIGEILKRREEKEKNGKKHI